MTLEKFPDVIGLELEEAKNRLEQTGADVKFFFTEPDRDKIPGGIDRVVRQRFLREEWHLTVCKVPDAYR